MPKDTNKKTLVRQWEMLRLLPDKRPGKTVRDISAELENLGISVSKRTIERDLHDLEDVFGIGCNDKGKPFGWYWLHGTGVNLPALTLTDALSLQLVEQYIRPLLPTQMLSAVENRFTEAKNKLDALADDNKNARWTKKVRYKSVNQQLLPPTIREGVLETVQSALLDDTQLEVDYKRPGEDEPYTTVLHPLGLVQAGPSTYLIATVRDYQDTLLFALHRILQATQKTEDIIRSKSFDIDDYMNGAELVFGSRGKIKLKANVSESLFNILDETPLSDDQTLESNGNGARLAATMEDSWQLHWWILSQGDGIEVVQPKSLKNQIVRGLKSALRQYENE